MLTKSDITILMQQVDVTKAYDQPTAAAVDIRADIYSLGVVMYEMIAGRRPNEGENAMRTLAKALDGQAFPDVRTFRPDTPAYLADLVADMTRPDRAARPDSARQVIERLSRPVPPAAEADSFAAPAGARPPWYRDRGVLYAATAMILAVEALVVALGNVFMRS